MRELGSVVAFGVLAGTGLLAACTMPNPAYGGPDDTQDSGDGDGDGDGDGSGDGDGDGDGTGDGDGDGDGDACGNGEVDEGEACDGNDPPNATCTVDCELKCEHGWDDCNGDGEDGCEVDILGDPLNCGSCATDCLGEPCENGICGAFPLAEAVSAYDIALDSDHNAYWTDRGAGTVSRMSVAGVEPVEVLVTDADEPTSIAVGEQGWYYTDWGAGTITGRGFDNQDMFVEGYAGAWALATGGGEVMWGNYTAGDAWVRPEGADAQAQPLFTGQTSLAALGWRDGVTAWSANGLGGGTVGAVLDEPTPLAIGLGNGLGEIAVYDGHAYVTASGPGVVYKIQLDAGAAQVSTIATEQGEPYGIVVCRDWVYWGNAGSGEIMGMSLTTGDLVVMAEGHTSVRGMDCDGTYLVWVRNAGVSGAWAMVVG